jgi:hypothetical protein
MGARTVVVFSFSFHFHGKSAQFCKWFLQFSTYTLQSNRMIYITKTKLNSVSWVRERSIPNELRRLSTQLVPIFVDRGCLVVSVTDTYDHILGFLDRRRYFFFELAPQLYSRGWVDPVPDPLLLRKSGRAGNRTRTSRSVARGGQRNDLCTIYLESQLLYFLKRDQ